MLLKLSLFLLTIFSFHALHAQDLSVPGAYMSHISDQVDKVSQSYMNYLSAVSHGKSARKVEKLREKTLNTIQEARGEVAGTPTFKGDRSLKDATVEYLKTCYIVFNEDYAMEAYLMAQEKAGEKLEEAGDKRGKVFREFAQKNNVQIIDNKSELDEKLEKSSRVNEYYNKIYLIFFKSLRQDLYLIDAIAKADINAIEQNRNALSNYSTAGLEQLSGTDAFNSDASLVTACKKALMLYKEIADKKMNSVTEYLLAEENFKKVKKAMESKPANQRSQADIDNYNKAVNEINKSLNAFNKANSDMTKERNEVINLWNSSVKRFMDLHTPYAK
jgi:hypothetical protein